MSIKVEGLTKIYGDQKAVDNISFETRPGEVLGFLGPNGAGKSTTMKVITCFIPQTEGVVNVCGFDINESSMDVRRVVGYLPESNPLYKDMYVREYLEFISRIHKIPKMKSRITEMIGMTGLDREKHKKIGQLSKGYRQRVGLAQAMLHDPKVLVLDEPTSGLDPNQLVEIRELIIRLGKEKTVILSTHIMQEVQAMCDRVIIINRGKMVANDSTDKLQEKAAGKSIFNVEFKETFEMNILRSITGIQSVNQTGANKYDLIASDNNDLREQIFQFAKNNNLTLLTLMKEKQSLENVFRELTK